MKTFRKKGKFIFRNLKAYQKYNLIAILICSFFVLSLTVGYAILSSNLDIKGDIAIRVKKDIRITSFGNIQTTSNGVEKYNSKYDVNTITSNIELPNLDSTVTYTGTIKNSSDKVKEISNIENVIFNNDKITYTLDNLKVSQTINSNSELTFTITFKYIEGLSSVPENTDLGANIKLTFEDKKEIDSNYISNDLLIDLRGTDKPVNNKWIDKANNKEFTLTNVSYNESKNCYTFSGNGAARVNEAIIPATGDFTVEMKSSYPANITSKADQAVVAQVNDSKNDDGRFKLNYHYENNSNKILSFFNDTSKKTNIFLYGTTTASTGRLYNVQVVRQDSQMKIYIDGVLTSTQDYNKAAKISQGPFKLGTWNTSDNQYYTGDIYSVRVYNKALTNDEIANNTTVDNYLYQQSVPVEKPSHLTEYIKKNQIDTNGGDVYNDNLGNYVYRGSTPSNYLKISGSNNTYRIISANSDNTLKVIDTTNKYATAFDDSGARDPETSSYCVASKSTASDGSFQGCNAWSKQTEFSNGTTTGTVEKDATIVDKLNNDYYNNVLDSSTRSKITTHAFAVAPAVYNVSREEQNIASIKYTWTGKVGLPTIADIINTAIESQSINKNQKSISNNWIKLGISNEAIWTMSADSTNTFDVYIILNGKEYTSRRASRTTQSPATFYAQPSFYINGYVSYDGTGSESDPFIIN